MSGKGLRAVLALALLLAGCGEAAPAPRLPAVPVGSLGAPIALAPLVLAGGDPPTVLAGGGARALAAPFLVAPATDLRRLAERGFTAVAGLCQRSPEVLLWHRAQVFAWPDLAGGPLYLAPGADAATLAVAVGRYRDVLDKLPKVQAAAGGVRAFLADPGSFLLAPEPLASAFVLAARAHIAQPLADELGPYPTCLVYARRSVLHQDPLLVLSLLRRLDLGLWRLAEHATRRELPELRALAPTLAPTAVLRAMQAANAEGIFRQTVLLDAEDLRLLHDEILPGVWPRGALDLGPARAALERPFVR